MEETIEKLLDQIDYEINKVPSNSMNIYEHLRKKSLESKKQRLLKTRDILKIEKYNIVFIGTIGIGKTTAICHLFNLIGEFEREIEINKIKKQVKTVEPLLSTGSGRTTISEVITKASANTYIQIEPYSKEELYKLIEEFCKAFYGEDEIVEGDILSVELERAIRTITDLKKNQKVNDKNVDVAREYSKKMSLEDFKILALKNADLDSRKFTKDESILNCPTDVNEALWLKQNFERVNKGEEATFSIPKKIFLFVSDKILTGSKLGYFNSIVDTKGIDEIAIRPDLQNYIEAEENICLFTTGFNDAPETNIRELMKFSLSQRSKNYEQKFVTLVLPHKGEAEKENDSDGTWESGVQTRKTVIENVFNNQNIKFLSGNIHFYDALQFYDSKGRRDKDFSLDDIQAVKDNVIDDIRMVIEHRKKILIDEIKNIEESVERIAKGNSLPDSEIQKINSVVNEIASFRELRNKIPSFVYEEFIDQYIGYYSERYPAWNTKDAIHRRLGTFYERSFSTYFDAKVIAEGIDDEEMLKKFTGNIRTDLISLILKLGETHTDLQSLTPEIIKSLDLFYDEFVEGVGDEIEKVLQSENENVDFWYELINRRGKGTGYNIEVATMLRRKLEYFNHGVSANRVLQEITEKKWGAFIDKILNFFQVN